MENQKDNYYINKRRKIADFIGGILAALLAWMLGIYLITILFGIFTGSEAYGIPGLVISPFVIAIVSAVWLYFKPKRKFILIGALATTILPIFIAGSCSLYIWGVNR